MYGILGLVVFVKALSAVTGPDSHGRSYISGGLTLAVLVMPIVILITMEALRAVPPSIREARVRRGRHALGGRAVSHVLPYAAPGIFTGAILAMARAFGETAPLLLVGAVTGYFSRPRAAPRSEVLQGPYTALPTQIFSWSPSCRPTSGSRTRQPPSSCCWWSILVVNFLAILLRNRYERKW